jgi:uncharacterized protein (DUF697 family)
MSAVTVTTVSTEYRADPVREAREHQANAVISKYTKWAAGLSLIPVPLLDVAFIIGAQVSMLGELSEVYEVKFSRGIARSLITSLIGGLGAGALAGGTTAFLAKLIPGNGLLMTVVGAASMSGWAAATTYAIGKVFAMHFASGGTMFTFDPKEMHQHFSELYREKLHKDKAPTPAPAPTSTPSSGASSVSVVTPTIEASAKKTT